MSKRNKTTSRAFFCVGILNNALMQATYGVNVMYDGGPGEAKVFQCHVTVRVSLLVR